MPDSVDSGVSESDVMSMFDKDGDLRDEPQSDEDDSAAEDQETEEPEEGEPEPEEATEPEEEEPSEEEDAPKSEEKQLDWSKVDPAHRNAFEEKAKEVLKLRKDYGKIQSKLHEVSQSRRQEDQTMQELQAQASQANQWNEILEQHPELVEKFVDLVKKARNPIEEEIPEHLKGDPAFQYLEKTYKPYIRGLEQKLAALESQTKPLNDWKAEKETAANTAKLDSILGDAATQFKAMFKRDITEDEKTAVLKFMVENDYYQSGKNATREVFASHYEKALTAKRNSDLKAKAEKFGTRQKTVNSRQASSAPKINSHTDAITQALRDQGIEL